MRDPVTSWYRPLPLGAHAFGLRRSEDGEPDSVLGQNLQTLGVRRCFRQPHAFRLAAEAGFRNRAIPHFTCVTLSRRFANGQDHVVIALRNGRSVSGKSLAAFSVSFDDRRVHVRSQFLHPRQQRRTEVEADSA